MKKLFVIIFAICSIYSSCDKPIGPPIDNTPSKPKIFINEFMAVNTKTIKDEANQYDDWIELYNAADTSVNLSSYYLSDKFSITNKWKFPAITILPKEFLLIWCDDDTLQGPLHVNFKLSSSGEQLALFMPDGKILDSLSFGIQYADTSFGRFPDGTNNWKYMPMPTPGAANK